MNPADIDRWLQDPNALVSAPAPHSVGTGHWVGGVAVGDGEFAPALKIDEWVRELLANGARALSLHLDLLGASVAHLQWMVAHHPALTAVERERMVAQISGLTLHERSVKRVISEYILRRRVQSEKAAPKVFTSVPKAGMVANSDLFPGRPT
jgi:hypothetical protein